MKKILAIALAVCFVFATVGCTQPAAAPDPRHSPRADAAFRSPNAGPAIKTVVEGKLTVALSPTFRDGVCRHHQIGSGSVVGFESTLPTTWPTNGPRAGDQADVV